MFRRSPDSPNTIQNTIHWKWVGKKTMQTFLLLFVIQTGQIVLPNQSVATSKMIGKSIDFYGESRTRLCFNNGVCNWGNWIPIFLRAYFGKNGTVYWYNRSKKTGRSQQIGRYDDGYKLELKGNKVYLSNKDSRMLLQQIYTVRGNSCKSKSRVKFYDSNGGRIVRERWRKVRCKVVKGNPF